MVRAVKLFEQLANNIEAEKEAARKAKASGNRSTKKKILQSTRFDAMYIPNHSWDFFDTYTGALPTATALQQHESSTEGKNLQKYLKVIHEHNKDELSKSMIRPGRKPLPSYLVQLLQLQERSGKFEHLQDVLVAFGMPFHLTFQFQERYEEHEFACAYAIALMRQHTEFFDLLVEAHDKALKWVQTNELIYQAREHINQHFQTINYCINPFNSASTVSSASGRSELGTYPLPNDSFHTDGKGSIGEATVGSVSEVATVESATSSLSSIALHADASSHQLAMNQNAFQFTAVSKDLKNTVIREEDHDDLDSISSSVIQQAAVTANQGSRPGSPSKEAFSNLLSSLHQFSGAFSEEKLNAQRKVVDDIEIAVINLCMEIEDYAKEISLCLDRCVAAYNASELFINRYKTFDELTARLGEGFPPTPAYDDWRKEGVPGMRHKMIKFFNMVQYMSEERLTLREMLTPEGRDWSKKNNLDFNRSRWILAWNGHDVVLKVLHCLDFLRKCRELSDWYGPTYYFVANPLHLPFSLGRAYEELQLDGRVMELLKTQPHDRIGIGNVEQKRDWSFQQFLNDFRRRFIVLTQDWSFNWPILPPIREDDENYDFGIAMLVLFVASGDSIRRSNQWEKRFITSISSLRGAAHHLVGEANLRTNKPLKVPPLEERVPRPALMKQMEELLKKRQSMRMKSTDQDLNQDSSMFSYSFETHSATESSIQPEGSGAGLRKLDAEDDYYQIHLHNQNKIKQFAKMLNQAGGALESDAQIVEKANINPNSAPVAFKYDPTKRRSTSAGKKRASVSQPGGASPQRKQSTLSPMRRVSNALQPDGSPGANTGSTRLSIRSSVLQQRGSISQPPTLNASSSAVLSPLKEERNAVGRKLSTVVDLQNPSPGKRQLTNQRTSVLRKSSTLATLHESENPKPTTAPSSRPTSGRPSSAKPMTISRPSSAHLPSPQGNAKKSIIVANSNNAPVRASMISAPQSLGMEKSALTASTGSEVFDTNAGGAMDGAQIKAVLSATVGRKSGFDQRKTINNTNAKKKMSVTQPLKGESIFSLQSDSVPHPIAAGVTMPAVKEEQRPKSRPSKIIDREALSKEGTQSRKVSRLPAMKDAITTEAGGVISTQKMTKRRP